MCSNRISHDYKNEVYNRIISSNRYKSVKKDKDIFVRNLQTIAIIIFIITIIHTFFKI